MNRFAFILSLACIVALAAFGISKLNRVNHNQVQTHDGEKCFTVAHATKFYNSYRDAKGKLVIVADKLPKGSRICRR